MIDQGDSKCKGPEVRACLLHSKAVRGLCARDGVGVEGDGVREVGGVVLL